MKKSKRNNSYIYILLLVVFSIYSCSRKDTNEQIYYRGDTLNLKKRFYDNGKIKEETFNKDSLTHGYIKEYYPSGQLKDMTEYIEGKKNGKTEGYYPNGVLENAGWFNQGKQDSIWIWYYNDGKLEAKDSWLNGKCFGSNYKYYPNQILKEFFFCNVYGDVIYKREYDQNGKMTSESGKALDVVYNKNRLKVGETFEAINFVAIAPKIGFNLDLVLKDKSGKIMSTKKVDNKEFENVFLAQRYIYELKLNQPGEYTFLSILNRNDSTNNDIKKDTTRINLSIDK